MRAFRWVGRQCYRPSDHRDGRRRAHPSERHGDCRADPCRPTDSHENLDDADRLDESHGHHANDGLRHLCAVVYDHRPSDARHRAVACGHQPSDARCLPRDAHGHHDGHGT